MKRIMASAAAVTLLSGGLAVVAAGPASAYCTEVGNVYYSFGSPTTVWKATSLKSSYITGPGTITFTKGRTWTVSASMTATVSAEAGVVFAKASTSLGVTVGASYAGTLGWAYALNVGAGKTMAMQQYKSARKFLVTKKTIVAPCDVKVVYSSTPTAPVASNADSNFKYALVY